MTEEKQTTEETKTAATPDAAAQVKSALGSIQQEVASAVKSALGEHTAKQSTQESVDTMYTQFKNYDEQSYPAEDLQQITKLAKTLGLDQTGAQVLFDYSVSTVKELAKNIDKEIAKEEQERLVTANEKLKNAFGDNLEAVTRLAGAGFNKHITDPGLREIIENGEIGSHPEFIRFLAKLGEASADDSVISGKTAGRGNPLHSRSPRTNYDPHNAFEGLKDSFSKAFANQGVDRFSIPH